MIRVGETMTGGTTIRGRKLRPISARYMHAKEVAKYEKAMARVEER